MKKIISLTLAALMLVTLLLTATSCGMESMTGYTRLRDHLIDTVGENQAQELDAQSVNLQSASISVVTLEGGDREVRAVAYAVAQSYVLQITLQMDGSVEKAHLFYEVLSAANAKQISTAHATILLTHYTGNESVDFTATENIPPVNEQINRENATALLNSLLLALDTYTTKNLDMDLHELGFIALSDKYMADVETTVTEEDLGGAFSGARLAYAGRMLLQGIGMVFLVLAILWLVLLIFKKVFYKDPAKLEKKSEPRPSKVEPPPFTPVSASVDDAPDTDDGALVAAITAAVSAYIESDPTLASQFAGGFRVVSFKPTTKSRNR
ncbi:MAG: OadG family protein [Clostridia bacterium]|nr:OadG family protein [Clostridia bacterium]